MNLIFILLTYIRIISKICEDKIVIYGEPQLKSLLNTVKGRGGYIFSPQCLNSGNGLNNYYGNMVDH